MFEVVYREYNIINRGFCKDQIQFCTWIGFMHELTSDCALYDSGLEQNIAIATHLSIIWQNAHVGCLALS